MDTPSLVLGLAFCLVGSVHANYNITVLGASTRSFGCPLPDRCPPYTEQFLANYRYLNPRPTKTCTVGDIRAALIKLQEFHVGLPGVMVTGECDNTTLALFKKPRCGCEDIVVEDDAKQKMMMMANNLNGPQAFAVFNSKWPKTQLTWKVSKYPVHNRNLTKKDVNSAMKRGLDIWAQQTPLTFRKVSANSVADIDIKFERGRHQKSEPFYDFDGKGGVLAHAFPPTAGWMHFDDDETYVLNSDKGIELYVVAAHEFGHILGISHSAVEGALMYPVYKYTRRLVLHNDDIQAIQTLYGAGTRPEVVTKHAPPRPALTTPNPDTPNYCNMRIQAAFRIDRTTFVFTNDPNQPHMSVVYKVDRRNGLDPNSMVPLSELFKKKSNERWPRAHPYRVDAATYIPNTGQIFLFSGTRVYRYRYTYTHSTGPFYLDENAGYPKWIDVSEFPERPRAVVPMQLGRSHEYYMLIFGKTRVWNWDYGRQRVGAWDYPISSFGRNMPQVVHTAFLENPGTVVFIKGDRYVRFDVRTRHVSEEEGSVLSVKMDFLKGRCM